MHSQRGQCAKRISILDAAAEVFCRQGFAGASIDEIAAEACVSRQTVYNHYREKENLFTAVVEDVMDRANAMLFSILSTFPENPDNLEDDLTAFAVRLSRNCICNQDGKFLRRLVQSEGERYPHLFESWRQHGPGKIGTALAALFARLAHKGLLADRRFRPRRTAVPRAGQCRSADEYPVRRKTNGGRTGKCRAQCGTDVSSGLWRNDVIAIGVRNTARRALSST